MHTSLPESYPAEGQDAAQMSCKIYVGNLAWATDENALSSHFASVGEVKGAVVMRSEGRSRGFGFVTFANPEQAKRAIETMYESELHGRRLRVNVANQLIRGGGSGAGDYPMNNGNAQGGYNYPTGPYPGAAISYGGYSHPPPPAHGAYMGGGYMNPPNNYHGNETGGYTAGAPTNHPMADGRKGSNQPGGFYPNGSSYPYPPGGYGY